MADNALGEMIQALGKARQELLNEVTRLRPEQLGTRAAGEEWDVQQILKHMTYAEHRYSTNIEAIRTALSLSHDGDLAALLAEWQLARESLLQVLALVTPEQIDRRIPGHDRTIREWVAMALAHDRAHAAQLRQILDQNKD